MLEDHQCARCGRLTLEQISIICAGASSSATQTVVINTFVLFRLTDIDCIAIFLIFIVLKSTITGHANVASILIPISLMGYASVAQSTHTAAATTTPMATTTSSLGLTEVPLYHLSLDGELSSGVWIEIAIGTPPQQAAILLGEMILSGHGC